MLSFRWSSNIFTKDILAILRETINLVELSIKLPVECPDTERGRLIHLPHLERLSIVDVACLSILDTPSLQQLKTGSYSSQPVSLDDVGIIAAFLCRLGIKLSTLVIEHAPAAIVIEILRFTPEIDKLVLLLIEDMDDVFMWLAGTGRLLCSNLRVLFAYLMLNEKGFGALQDMIARRNPLGDGKDPSPKEVIVIDKGKSSVANLELLCRDRGVRFESAQSISAAMPWVDL
jgi:hypothetical protein